MINMTTTFAKLSTQLGLTPTYQKAEQLQHLENWCHEHISSDICYQGHPDNRYSQYLTLAKYFIDEFLNHVPTNIEETSPHFNQMNAIQYAAQQGYDQFITAQTSLADDTLNKTNTDGMTPLHLSASKGHVHTTQALLAKGANPRIPNNESQLPIHLALFVPARHDKKLITKKIAIFKQLMASAPDTIEHEDSSGESIFHLMASEQEFCPLMATLLKKNEQGAFYCNHRSQYPIHTAILNNQLANAKLLLAIDKCALLADTKHQVALHYAARYGTKEMVQHCCEATANINIQDIAQKTPLILATEANNLTAVETLIQNGAM